MTTPLTRRSLLTGCVTVAVGGIAGYAVTRSTDAAKAKPTNAMPNGYGPATQPSTTAQPAPTLLTPLSEVPEGGGIVLGSQKVVVTREPSTDGRTAGRPHAFSAVCTHQGCTVSQVENGTIDCPCHGSKFNAITGAVVNGPATTPLPKISITVKGGNVYRT
jgi:Rieske Fe-S protein